MDDFTILTVCSGNICRSPIAEQVLRAGTRDIDGLVYSSAGTIARDGDEMPRQAQRIAVLLGGDPTGHGSRYLTERIVSGSRLVLALSREHRRAAVEMWPRAVRYAFTLREFARLAEGLTDEDLAGVASIPIEDTAARMSELVSVVAAQKGQAAHPVNPADDDVIDPFGQDDTTYSLSGEQIAPATEIVVRVLKRAATITAWRDPHGTA
jgi:protein-tyrosine phosphatase